MSGSARFRLRPKQRQFVESTATFTFYIGGLGAGKTFSGAVRTLKYAIEYPGSLGLIGAPTFPMLRDTTQRTFEEICPQGVIRQHNKLENKYYLTNGTEILLRSMDDPNKSRGVNLSWYWMDEAPLCGYYAWQVLKGRAGRQNPRKYPRAGWATGTPKGKDGFYEDFENNPKPDHLLIRASTYENLVNLPDGYIEGLGYQGNFAKQEIEGLFTAFEGLVYEDFKGDTRRGAHLYPFGLYFRLPSGRLLKDSDQGFIELQESDEKPHEDAIITLTRTLGGVDWGWNNPAVCNILGIDRHQRVYHLQEFYQRRVSKTQIFLPLICNFAEHFECEAVYCDPMDPTSIHDLKAEIDKRGLSTAIKAADNNKINGIQTMRSFLTLRSDGMPGFLVHETHCPNTVHEFGSYQYPTKEGQERNPTELPVEQNDHSMDSVRYVLHSFFGAGRTAEIARASSKTLDPTSEQFDLNLAERQLEELVKQLQDQRAEEMARRGQQNARFLRGLSEQGFVLNDGLWRPS